MNVIIIDYGMGNIGSVSRAIEECGGNVLVTHDPADIDKADKIVLPGVGAFPDGMKALINTGWDKAIKKVVSDDDKTILGICLGMQLFATKSYEGNETDGLNLIPGTVEKLRALSVNERIPHIGWNEVTPKCNSQLMSGIASGTDYYFVHSYHFIPDDEKAVLAYSPYCGGFVSSISRHNIFGVQFHPEKSSKAGFKIIKNFMQI
jgi:glutamine amidotransferase